MKTFRTGLVVGKFSPLHFGHEHLISTAIDQCDQVIVVSYSKPEFEHCDAENRRMWLHTRFPNVRSVVIDGTQTYFKVSPLYEIEIPTNDDSAEDHREFCFKILLYHLHTSVDAVFSSEVYGEGFAAYLTARFADEIGSKRIVQHVCVDLDRVFMPISGTKLREQREFLNTYVSADVRASFIDRLVILGGESSGKTTLAAALGMKFHQEPIWEYGRELTEKIGGTENLRYEDLEAIAEEQVHREHLASRGARLDVPLICDTSPLTTMFYSEQMFRHVSPRLRKLALETKYKYTILCSPTIPFENDGTRFDSKFRDLGHAFYVRMLYGYDIPYLTVSGTVEERVQQVLKYIK